jgi:single-strand DNA-binding protein
MYNKVILVGYLTRDVEIRYSPSGSAIGSVGIATNRKWKSQTGEQRDETMFIDLTFFGRTAEIAHQYIRKGSKVLVDGRLVFQQWTTQDGSKRSKHTITVENLKMLDTKAESSALGSYGGTDSGQIYNQPAQQPQQSRSGSEYYSNTVQSQQLPQHSHSQQQPPLNYSQQQKQQMSVPEIDIDEDEIPF